MNWPSMQCATTAGTQIQSPNGTIHTQVPSRVRWRQPSDRPCHAEASPGPGCAVVALEIQCESQRYEVAGTGTDRLRRHSAVAAGLRNPCFGYQPERRHPDSRPGLSSVSGMTFTYGSSSAMASEGGRPSFVLAVRCRSDCLANPAVQEIGALPTGTSAPNTVITSTPCGSSASDRPPTTGWSRAHSRSLQPDQQCRAGRFDHPDLGGVEERSADIVCCRRLGHHFGSSSPSACSDVRRTVRSETANDLRTLTAAGASSYTGGR